MLDQNERHAGIIRQMSEELLEGFETARRCADADDRKRTNAVFTVTDWTLVMLFGNSER